MNLKSVGVALFIGLWAPALTATDGIDPMFSARQALSGEWESFEKLALQPLRQQLELALFDRREEKVTNWPQGVLGVRVVTPQASWQDERIPGLWQKIQALNPSKVIKESESSGEGELWRFIPIHADGRKLFWLSRFERGSEFQFLVERSALGAWERLKVLLPAGVWLITQDYRIVFPEEHFAQTLESYPFQADAHWEGEWQGKKLVTRAVRLAGTNLLFLHLQSPSGLPLKKIALLLGIALILMGLSWFIWWYRNQAKKPQSSQSLSPALSPAAQAVAKSHLPSSQDPRSAGRESSVASSPMSSPSSAEAVTSDRTEGPLALLLKQLQLWQLDMGKYNLEWQSEDRILERVLSQWRLKPEQLSQNLGLFYPGREWLWPQELLTRLIRLFLPQEITSAKLQVQGVDEGEAQKIRAELVGEPAAWLKDSLQWRYTLPEAWTLHWGYEPSEGSGRLVIDFMVRHRLPQGRAAIRASELLKDEFIDKMIEQLEEPMESESVFAALSEDPLAQPNPHQRISLETARLKKIKGFALDAQNIDVRPPKEKNS